MSRKLYLVLLIGSALGAVLAIALAALLPNPWQLFLGALSGALASLAASTIIQSFASAEQEETLHRITSDQERMLRAVTLSIPGIRALPRDFLDLHWMAYTTQVASDDAAQKSVGRFSPLKKLRVVGKNIVEYERPLPWWYLTRPFRM